MQLTENHIASKKRIGTLNGRPVVAICTTGGLNLLVASKSDGSDEVETLGVGPHAAIAKFVARKKYPGLKIDTLEKSDWVDPACFQHLVPEYEALTARLNRL